ncbi:hypothetical protein [Hymenobacter guriensis]|uniref:Uncharacterized protein n=1 Tax=Hymenobacter guriensis TaxID=2793065 RepID=A0ABS0L4U5_9BACT|nr:hypothetical protein [Hymenobacter guriensis]MBG8554402.1 hypothetical protein [Hymenobacter guriensis]
MSTLRSLRFSGLLMGSLLLVGSAQAAVPSVVTGQVGPGAQEMPRQRARQLTDYLTDALDLSAEQSRQLERCTYAHLRRKQQASHRLPGAARRAERRYLASLGRVLRPSQLATYFWLDDQQPMAVVRLSAPRF